MVFNSKLRLKNSKLYLLKADPPERPGYGRFKKDPNRYHGLFKQVC